MRGGERGCGLLDGGPQDCGAGSVCRALHGSGRAEGRGSAGALQALVAATLASLSIWLMMAINMSGGVLNIFREPSIWVESLIVAQAVFVYAVIVGLLLSPVSGTAIRLLARP
ncbi:hypothetical protein [Rubrobacter indicoceani]|uniref:hypothetical protein n=1 Tax=Rubrobacter indicoceani TaxID=2051957 RepID=UPI0013C4155F|nr:hypothetical protein [Rubrobacter indicoceani]